MFYFVLLRLTLLSVFVCVCGMKRGVIVVDDDPDINVKVVKCSQSSGNVVDPVDFLSAVSSPF